MAASNDMDLLSLAQDAEAYLHDAIAALDDEDDPDEGPDVGMALALLREFRSKVAQVLAQKHTERT